MHLMSHLNDGFTWNIVNNWNHYLANLVSSQSPATVVIVISFHNGWHHNVSSHVSRQKRLIVQIIIKWPSFTKCITKYIYIIQPHHPCFPQNNHPRIDFQEHLQETLLRPNVTSSKKKLINSSSHRCIHKIHGLQIYWWYPYPHFVGQISI
jgi:hypothetical protein